MREVGLQQAFDGPRRVFGFDIAKDLGAARGMRAKTAAGINVIALHRVALLAGRDAGSKQADVADVMLGTGVVTAGQMNVERSVDRRTRLAMRDDVVGMALGVAGGELAAGVAGAGDD